MDGDSRNVFQLRVDVRWYGYTKLLQHAFQALHGKRCLTGLVAGTIEPDNQSISDQLVTAHTVNVGQILDAFGLTV